MRTLVPLWSLLVLSTTAAAQGDGLANEETRDFDRQYFCADEEGGEEYIEISLVDADRINEMSANPSLPPEAVEGLRAIAEGIQESVGVDAMIGAVVIVICLLIGAYDFWTTLRKRKNGSGNGGKESN